MGDEPEKELWKDEDNPGDNPCPSDGAKFEARLWPNVGAKLDPRLCPNEVTRPDPSAGAPKVEKVGLALKGEFNVKFGGRAEAIEVKVWGREKVGERGVGLGLCMGDRGSDVPIGGMWRPGGGDGEDR